jgi:transposase
MKPRRKFTGEYKAKLVLEMLSGQRSAADIARKEGIKDTLLHEWRAEFIRNAPQVFGVSAAQAEHEQSNKVSELEQVIGRLTIENEVLKKASRWLNGMSGSNGRSR